jgi:hypothetical protein
MFLLNHFPLVFFRPTTQKISYHFIHANSSIFFENATILGIFIKVVIHFLLLLIVQHKCTIFNITLPEDQVTITNLIQVLAPHMNKNTLSLFFEIKDIMIEYFRTAKILSDDQFCHNEDDIMW